jgi:hypothetical protein
MTTPERMPMHEYAEPYTYVERLGVGIGQVLETLAAPPENPLSQQEREAFFAIDAGLLEGRYDRDLGEGIDGAVGEVGDWYKSPEAPINFVLDYFLTEAGAKDLRTIEQEYDVTTAPRAEHQGVGQAQRLAVLGRLAGENKAMEAALKELASRSQKFTVERVAATVAQEDGQIEDSPHLYVFTHPEKVMGQVRQVQHMRTFLRGVRQDVHRREDVTDTVKAALLTSVDGLRQKATAQMGELYPSVINMYHQALLLQDIDPVYANGLLEELAELSAPMRRVVTAAESDPDVEERFVFTMDRWRNGVVGGPDDTSFSGELLALEQNLDARVEADTGDLEAAFTPEEIAYLDSLEYNAEDMADMARYWLERNGLLSTDTYDMFKRGNWPSDSMPGQPRVGVVVGKFSNLAYNRGWVLIPSSAVRKLRQQAPSGPAFVIPHELQHVIDGITAEYGEQQVAVAKASARNSTGVREGVGKQEEDMVSRELFGEPLHQSTVYIKALRAWGETGSESAAIIAYADQAAREQGRDRPDKKLFTTAQNRVQRLIKAGMHAANGWNSQPLVYAEQVLVAQGLEAVPPYVHNIVAANSYLDLSLMARFHEFGLLATQRYQPEVSPVQAMKEYLKQQLLERANA